MRARAGSASVRVMSNVLIGGRGQREKRGRRLLRWGGGPRQDYRWLVGAGSMSARCRSRRCYALASLPRLSQWR